MTAKQLPFGTLPWSSRLPAKINKSKCLRRRAHFEISWQRDGASSCNSAPLSAIMRMAASKLDPNISSVLDQHMNVPEIQITITQLTYRRSTCMCGRLSVRLRTPRANSTQSHGPTTRRFCHSLNRRSVKLLWSHLWGSKRRANT